MKIFDSLEIYPGAPGTQPNGVGVHALKLKSTGAGKRPYGRTTLDFMLASDWCFRDNVDPMHLIVQMRACTNGWDSGFYRGHGLALGPLHGGVPVGMLESWGRQYAKGPGGNYILPLSRSPVLRDVTLYRCRVSSLLTKAGSKHLGFAIWEPDQPTLFDTGDCEDNNADVDMDMDGLFIGAHFARRDHEPAVKASPCGVMRLMNGYITHADDATAMPDLRRLWENK